MQSTEDREQAELAAEWAKMQGLGSHLAKKRLVATAAGMAIVGVGFLGSLALYLVWPFDKIAVWMLAAPIALSLAAGWAVRAKLWPKGQFG